jgi:hypothetical protein
MNTDELANKRKYSNWRNSYLKALESIFTAHHDEIIGLLDDSECTAFNDVLASKPTKPRKRKDATS